MHFEPAIRITLLILGYFTILVSLIPLLRYEAWYIRIFDYPRSQKFWINLAVLVLFIIFAFTNTTQDFVFTGLLIANQIYLLSQIWDYTTFARNQMKRSATAGGNRIGLLIANVFQDNRDYEKCRAAIRKFNPDIFLLVETDHQWVESMNEFNATYPYKICQPQSNTYGICLFSKIKITSQKIRFLIEKDIPSIVADFKLSDGETFRLYGLHPKPPVPNESPDSKPRDAEILMVGKEAKKHSGPVIVAGDLNDVAWSFTTNLFLKTSGLLDPRIGRGFFSTFHAHHRFLRWPLDHVFFSSHFTLNNIRRIENIGSDHFPMYIEVDLNPVKIPENKKEQRVADENEKEIADEKIREAKVEAR